jgi:hypothetical protein
MLTRVQFEAELVSRKILYFPCVDLNTHVPHYFICVCNHPVDIVNLSCCTSQFDTVKQLIERRKFPNETLIYMQKSDVSNPFSKDTYVNCNEYFPFSIDELWTLYSSGQLTIIKDLLPIDSFEQILIGFNKSPIIEEEFKDSLPKIDDFF